MGRRSDPRWRDVASAELAAEAIGSSDPRGPVLVVWDSTDLLAGELAAMGFAVDRWRRMDTAGPGGVEPGSAWPEAGRYRTIAIRLPRSREALRLALHAAASVTEPGGVIFVYGSKDEGIGSSASRMEPLLGSVETVATGKRCRVLSARWDPGTPRDEPLHGSLSAWRSVSRIDLGGGEEEWVSYPGTFAGDRLDPGTGLLLRNLPPPDGGARVLDYGAGTGVLAAAVVRAVPGVRLVLVEPDALARAAASENLPEARFASVTEWPAAGPFDLVVSNPPYHEGKAESLDLIEALVRGAARCLAPGGEMRVVVQRRLPVGRMLEGAFARVDVVADEGPYRVWTASAT